MVFKIVVAGIIVGVALMFLWPTAKSMGQKFLEEIKDKDEDSK